MMGPAWARLAWGVTLAALAAPAPEPPVLSELAARLLRDPLARGLTTVLAARHLIEATAQARASRGGRVRAAAAVDVLHVASLPLLWRTSRDTDRRRLILLDAPVEAVLAALSLHAASQNTHPEQEQ